MKTADTDRSLEASEDPELDPEFAALGQAMVEDLRRGALQRWCIRAVVGAVVFGYLASEYSWGVVVIGIWIPVALASLWFILRTGKSGD